jgi:hypothetical protein
MSRTSKSLVAVVLVVVIAALLGYVYASPYIALDRMKRAADARDAQTVDEYVDFPLLRDSLKQQVAELLTRRIDMQRSGNPLALLGAMIGAALVGPLVDSYATPDGVAAILNGIPPRGDPGEKPPVPPDASNANNGSPPPVTSTPAPAPVPATPRQPPQTTMGYRSFDTFVVNYQHGTGDARYSAILQRYGLVSWKLVAIDLNG